MPHFHQVTRRITQLQIPYKDIFTSVYLVRTDRGCLLFDTGSCDGDVYEYILPFLESHSLGEKELMYVFLSHKHVDHAGGLHALMQKHPEITIISRSKKLADEFSEYRVDCPTDGELLLEGLQVVTLPGHTKDSCGLLDLSDRTLISGDSLQLYGIYGSGKWGANITLPTAHFQALDKLEQLEIARILTSHIYHPMPCVCEGSEMVLQALDACREPLVRIAELIRCNPSCSDGEIADLYNASGLPTLHERVVKAMRNERMAASGENLHFGEGCDPKPHSVSE